MIGTLSTTKKQVTPTEVVVADLEKDVMLKCVNEMMGRYAMETVAKEHAVALEAAEADTENEVKKEALKVWLIRLGSVMARYSRAEACFGCNSATAAES
jgi:hypothetical protein